MIPSEFLQVLILPWYKTRGQGFLNVMENNSGHKEFISICILYLLVVEDNSVIFILVYYNRVYLANYLSWITLVEDNYFVRVLSDSSLGYSFLRFSWQALNKRVKYLLGRGELWIALRL